MAKKATSKELGFGTLANANSQRFMNPDGSANVYRIGGPWLDGTDMFHKLTTMAWRKFFLIVLICYAIINIFFAFLYYFFGVEQIGMEPTGNFYKDFMECFFFSTQCFTTIGFGRVNPQGFGANIVASAEGLIGLMCFAIATGLLYGRFSRPRAQLLHSTNILVAPYRVSQRAVMFRIASTRKHSITIENTVTVSLGINQEENGALKRKFYSLALELDKINFMNLSWTLVHPITEESPLYGLSYNDVLEGRAEFIILFKGMEETTSQTVLERFSYFADEIVWGASFIPAIGVDEDGKPMLDLNKISSFQTAELPPLA